MLFQKIIPYLEPKFEAEGGHHPFFMTPRKDTNPFAYQLYAVAVVMKPPLCWPNNDRKVEMLKKLVCKKGLQAKNCN